MSAPEGQIYRFESFEIDPQKRLLLRDGQPVQLTSKAFDLLVVLVKNSGRVIAKDELMETVWHEQFVEEANLTVQMSALRKALGEKKDSPVFIVTVPGRGYSFVGDVRIGGANRGIVVETKRTSEFVVEEEIVVEDDTEIARRKAVTTTPLLKVDEAGLANLGFVADSSMPALPTAPAISHDKAGDWFYSHRLAVWLVGSAILLAVAVLAALWIYSSRNRREESGTPGKQMTMRRFTTHGGVPYRVAISPDGKLLVYLERINDKYSLSLGQIETNSCVSLIQQDPGVDNLVFSPDGSSIYFNVGDANRRLGKLVRMALLGGVITELIPHVDSPVTFAPDGKQMAFLRRDGETWRSASIIIADPDGQNQRALLTRSRAEQFSCPSLSWSPDGKSIAFSAHSDSGQVEILSVSVADGSVSKLSSRDWPDVGRVAWLPDGSALLVNAGENVGGQLRRIWLVSYPDGETRPITDDLNVFLRETTPSVSADGKVALLQSQVNSEIWIAPEGDVTRARRILRGVFPRFEGCDGMAWTPEGRLLYTAYVGNSQVIWSMSSDGSDQRQLTSNRANTSDSRMCATADGRYVVFQSNRSGSLEIWRVNSDGSNLKQLTAGGDNSMPSLSPDSRWIIYTSVRDGEATLWRISIEGGEPTQITETPSSVSQVSRDGQYIALMGWSPERLLIMPFGGGKPIKSFQVPQGRRLRWTQDGKAVMYPDVTQGVWLQALNEEKPRSLRDFEEMLVWHLDWSFDGKNLAYTTGPISQEIILLENFK